MGVSYTFVPGNDDKLLAWANTFKTILSANTAAYFMLPSQATTFAAAATAFASALGVANTPSTRTKGNIAAKDAAKKQLQNLARSFGKIIQANVQISDQMKIDIGVTVRKPPQPSLVPDVSPILEVESVSGWTINLRIRTPGSDRASMPKGAMGITLLSYVGPTPPTDPSKFKFEGSLGRGKAQVVFDSSLAPGTTVWLTAFYFNGRKESGPACQPLQSNILGSGMRLAA